ncbi:MAG: DUF2794 domain-containing protein [Stellaceae bacterium]
MATLFRLSDHRRRQRTVFFTRPELNQLLSLYSRQVARGEWRDYAIDHREGTAAFSVFRHTQESALYTVIKTAPGAGRQGDFALLSGRQRLTTGKALAEVLASLQHKLRGKAARLDGESAG